MPQMDFSLGDTEAVFKAIFTRRDIRSFRPDPVPAEALARILAAGHAAGSVGLMQPWNFLLIREPEQRRRVYDAFRDADSHASRHYESDRLEKYRSLKLQGILDAPENICITCDRSRGGPHVLGRDSMPDTDIYSTCLAIQNLWLSARALGLGIGWVSIVDPQRLANILDLPAHVVPIAYLCLGYPIEFPDEPMLKSVGWAERLPLESVVMADRWGGKAIILPETRVPPATPPTHGTIKLSFEARLPNLAIPKGGLGTLAGLAGKLAALQGTPRAGASRTALLFGADHGLSRHHISAYHRRLTFQIAYNIIAGGAAVNATARAVGAGVQLIDVGIDHDFAAAPGLHNRKISRGTADASIGPAMTTEQAGQAMRIGAETVQANLGTWMAMGEIGMGNTTSSAALLCAAIGCSPSEAVGRGTGIGDETLLRKRDLVRLILNATPVSTDPLSWLQAYGGFETAALAGAALESAKTDSPFVIDGFTTAVAALVASLIDARVKTVAIATHVGAEPGHALALAALGLTPIFNASLAVGEGAGALLALPMLDAAARFAAELRTFEEAGIAEPVDELGRK